MAKKIKQEKYEPPRRPFRPIAMDVSGMSEQDRRTLEKVLRGKGLIS